MASSGFELICTVLWLRPIIAFPLLLAPDRALVLDVWPPSSPSGLHSHTCLHTLHDSPIPQSGHVMFSGCPLSVLFPQPLQPLKFQRKHPFPGSCPPSSWARLRPPPSDSFITNATIYFWLFCPFLQLGSLFVLLISVDPGAPPGPGRCHVLNKRLSRE